MPWFSKIKIPVRVELVQDADPEKCRAHFLDLKDNDVLYTSPAVRWSVVEQVMETWAKVYGYEIVSVIPM